MTEQVELSEFEQKAPERARHRGLISQIIHKYPGLTTQQIIEKEKELYDYTFLTDNRLREMVKLGWVLKIKDAKKPARWYPKQTEKETQT